MPVQELFERLWLWAREQCAWQEVHKDTQNVPTLCRAVQDECVPHPYTFLRLMTLLCSSTDPRDKDCVPL